jgi:hypothetical protein
MRQNSIRTGNLPQLAIPIVTDKGKTYLDSPLLRLNLRIRHLPMVNDNRIPARPPRIRPPNAIREPRLGIRQKQLQSVSSHIPSSSWITYDIITRDLIRLAPRTHHKRIVRCQNSNNLHALFL